MKYTSNCNYLWKNTNKDKKKEKTNKCKLFDNKHSNFKSYNEEKPDFSSNNCKKNNGFYRIKGKSDNKKERENSERFIDITLAYEEALIFKEIFENMIEELEEKMISCELEEMSKISRRIDNIREEFRVFRRYNCI